MKYETVLCYGDSISWGHNPSDGKRFSFVICWPGVLELEPGGQVRVIDKALNGRTTNSDSPFLPGRNGAKVLWMSF